MSFQFTAYNTIAYDEIPPERMSAATSFYATFQQLMLSLGICVGAGALHLGMLAAAPVDPGLRRIHPGLSGRDRHLRLGDDLEHAVLQAGRPRAQRAVRRDGAGAHGAKPGGACSASAQDD